MKTKTTLAALLLAAVMVTPGYGADQPILKGAEDVLNNRDTHDGFFSPVTLLVLCNVTNFWCHIPYLQFQTGAKPFNLCGLLRNTSMTILKNTTLVMSVL